MDAETSAAPNALDLIVQPGLFDSGLLESSESPSWTRLRANWQDFLSDPVNDGRGVGRQRHRYLDLGTSKPPLRNRVGLSRDAADRALHKIISHFNEDSPRSAAQLKAWVKAKNAHAEVRTSLADIGYKEKDPVLGRSPPPPCAVDMEAASLFPKSWFRLLDESLMADLIVDAFTSTFVDAFVDGAVNMAELTFADETMKRASEETMRLDGGSYGHFGRQQRTRPGGRLPESASEPCLTDAAPSVFKPLVAPFRNLPILKPQRESRLPPELDMTRSSSSTSLRMASGRGSVAGGTLGSSGRQATGAGRSGFAMAGLPQDTHEAWLAHSYHASVPGDSLQSRIQQATTQQRPYRRLQRPIQDMSSDQRKYSWPMGRAHHPEAWNEMTKKKPSMRVPRAHQKGKRGQQVEEEAEEEEEAAKEKRNLLFLGPDGKTRFPYSLVLHKAFLESQPTEALKEKAKKVAPLRLSTGHLEGLT
eukprot:TRINITY_DN13187_c0_g2_i1.p1 TRINITY_DN13187_c0_g2~~TRINITY_DN13187_c0_g2_i1.p1  ORF type:complete len:475 (-),score=115.47 TRINITY_DN13187_c0_g2_i1:38-1462(-)